MSQTPDIFNQSIHNNPVSPFIVGPKDLYISRAEVAWTADCIVRGLLELGIKRGDVVCVVMSPSIKSIIAEVACFLGGYPLISIKSPKSLQSVISGTQKKIEKIYRTTNYRIKHIITEESYDSLLRGPKASSIDDFPEPQDLMYFGQTAGTTDIKNSIGKISLCTREKVYRQIVLNTNDNNVIDDEDCRWYAFGNPYSIYHSRTLQNIIINSGAVVYHNPELQTPDSIADIIEELQPCRLSYLKPVPNNAYDRDRISKISPLLAIDLMERPNKELLYIFKRAKQTNKRLKSFKMIGASSIRNSIELIEEIESYHTMMRFYNSFGSSEVAIKLASPWNDTLENRIHKHGKNRWGDSVIKLDDNGQMLIHTDYTSPYTENYESFLKDGVWFKTANRFKYDEHGYFEFLGRLRDD